MGEYGTSIAGQLLMQGLTNAGNEVQQGMQTYTQNKQKDAVLTGQIEPYLQGLQASRNSLSDLTGSALDKFVNGNATLKDKMLLYGDIASQQNQKNVQQQQQLTQQQITQGQLQNNMMQAKFGAMQAYANGTMPGSQPSAPPQAAPAPQGGQPGASPMPMQPQGAPQPGQTQRASTTVNPPTPISIDDPSIRALYPQALAATGYDPEKATAILQAQADAKNLQNRQNYDQLTKTVKDTGRLVYAQPNYNADTGLHDFDNYYNEQITGAGTASQSYTQGSKLIQYAAGSKPPVPVVTSAGQNAPMGQNGQNTFSPESDTAITPYNTTAPGWIKDNVQAQTDMAASAQRVANSRLLVAAANAYASGSTSQINALRGDPKFGALQQIFTGKNPGVALQTALSMNTGGVMNSLRSPQGGTAGSRTTAAEFEEADKQLATPNMDMPTILASAQNVNAINERAYAIDSAKAQYRKIMPEDKAVALAIAQFGAPPSLKAAGGASTTTQGPTARVVGPDGKAGNVPYANLQALLNMGFNQIQ